jgi:hypothetical protein
LSSYDSRIDLILGSSLYTELSLVNGAGINMSGGNRTGKSNKLAATKKRSIRAASEVGAKLNL